MTPPVTPIRLTQSSLAAAAEVFTRAFAEDPFIKQLYPNIETRQRCFATTTNCVLRYGLAYGEVHASSQELEGIAVWFPPAHTTPSMLDMLRFGFFGLPFSVGLRSFRRLWAYVILAEQMRERHVRSPHWYLQLLGVDPVHHGCGYGSHLLRHMLARLDREGVPCCLDTENEKNVAMYEHFGFRVRESGKIPGTQCGIWLMTRDIGATSSS